MKHKTRAAALMLVWEQYLQVQGTHLHWFISVVRALCFRDADGVADGTARSKESLSVDGRAVLRKTYSSQQHPVCTSGLLLRRDSQARLFDSQGRKASSPHGPPLPPAATQMNKPGGPDQYGPKRPFKF